jgi:uncharacterized membrane protein
MNFARWLLFVHISGVVLYVGGDVVLNMLALQAYRSRDPAGFLQVAKTASPVIGSGAVLTLLSGLGLVLQSDAWRFSMAWIIAGIAMIVMAGAAESIYFGKQLQAIRSTLDEKGADAPEIAGFLRKVVTAATVINALFFVVVWLMVFKPG